MKIRHVAYRIDIRYVHKLLYSLKNFIVQLMHTNYKILRLLKWIKL